MKADVQKPSVWEKARLKVEQLPDTSAIVVSYNSGPALRDCLFALKTDPQLSEVIVVNNGNPEKDLRWLERFCVAENKFRLITGHGTVGFAKGANLGGGSATGERLLFLNPDAILRRGSVAALELARDGLTEPCIVGGRVYGPDGREQRGGRRKMLRYTSAFTTFTGLSAFENLHSFFEDMNRLNEPDPLGAVSMPVVSGAMMYMSRTGFEVLGGFDEAYFLHVEDIDICRRASEVYGGDVVFTSLAGAMHYGGTSERSRLAVEWEKAKGLSLYFQRFSKSPMESMFAKSLAPVFAGLLMGRVAVQNLRHQMHDR